MGSSLSVSLLTVASWAISLSLSLVWWSLWHPLAAGMLLSLATYLLPQAVVKLLPPQDLSKRYPGAKWALVTGGSSGIGRAIVEKLASQGLNVVVVAYPDDLLSSSVEEYQKLWPKLEFRAVGVDLAGDFMEKLTEATADLDVSIVCNNAGYIKTGFFTDGAIGSLLSNHNVNASSAMMITHSFVQKMQEKNLRGCVTFTSSPASFMPCPFSVIYGATKAYLTEFACSLAPELRCDGIDVCVVHPSPVASRFYEGTHALDAIKFFKGTAVGPEAISDALFASIGRVVVRDQGYYPTAVRVLLKIVDYNLLTDVIAVMSSSLPDFVEMKRQAKAEKRD